MGRAKQYDREALLGRAVDLFHRQGFNGTSTAELVETLGVNRKTMYAEFGSKQELFEAVLEYYNDRNLSQVLARLEAPDAGADAIRRAFAGYARASEGWARGRGCLLCNTAVERAALDPGSARHVDAYLQRLTAAFRNALGNAHTHGELHEPGDLDDLASFFMVSLIGVAACAKAQASPAQISAACAVATGILGPQAAG